MSETDNFIPVLYLFKKSFNLIPFLGEFPSVPPYILEIGSFLLEKLQ